MGRAINKGVKWALSVFGLEVVRTARVPWGTNLARDVKRLAAMRRRSINTILDVGANVGQSALVFKDFFPGARIVCYEPSSRLFNKLTSNVRAHSTIQCINAALADTPGEMILHVYPELEHVNSLAATTRYSDRFPLQSEPVTCIVDTVDRSLINLGIDHVGFMKVDVEGFELEVLKGARNNLERGAIDYISAEFNEVRPAEGDAHGGALLPLVEYLQPFGYKFICSYTDWIAEQGDHFAVCNALFERRE